MEWIERLNCAINYIEEHLADEIDYTAAAKIACCSSYHFQRMFVYLAEVPLSEYIRRRKMTLAAWELQCTEIKIIDLALKYGYDSPTAFNRAFQSVHGVAPSFAKKEGVTLKSYTPISFRISIKGDMEMNYRIKTKESFRIVGVSEPLKTDVEDNFKLAPQLWQTVTADGTLNDLAAYMNGEPTGLLGASVCDEEEQWRYFIAVTSDKPVDEKYEEYVVPAATWAIFYGEGTMPNAIQELEKSIVTDWLPTSGYEYANAPDIEIYLTPDPQNAKFEVWIPIIKKENF